METLEEDMYKKAKLTVLSGLMSLAVVASAPAQIVVYDNLNTAATAGYSEANANNPVFGDALNLTQGGTVGIMGLSIYNSTSGGNTGSILAGNVTINIYDNTTPYGGGVLTSLPLLGSSTETLTFGAGLNAGFFTTESFDLSSLNITVPQNIFITQQFTETSGTSLRNGVVLFSAPTTGSSPATVYIESSATAEGLYTFTSNPNQFGYHVELVPEPSTLALAGLAGLAAFALRRRGA